MSISTFMKQAYYMPSGCGDQIENCKYSDRSSDEGQLACSQAMAICRSLVEGPYYPFSGRGTYDIRRSYGTIGTLTK